jgi:hypothetical protein
VEENNLESLGAGGNIILGMILKVRKCEIV